MEGLLFDKHLTLNDLESGIGDVLVSPTDAGTLELIGARPGVEKRKVLESGTLEISKGLVGDNWHTRGSSRTIDKSAHPEMQLNVMNYRFAMFVAGSRDRVPLAGDQLFVDLDLSRENLPPGTRLAIGSAVIEITPIPHLGCKKFVNRFGVEAMKFANSEFGRRHNLRGVNARIIVGGDITVGDVITKQNV